MKDSYLNVELLGDGSVADPWRVDLPTGYLVGVDREHRQAVVRVPEDVWPSELPSSESAEFEPIFGALALVACKPDTLAAWWKHLKQLYPRDEPWEPRPLRPVKDATYTE